MNFGQFIVMMVGFLLLSSPLFLLSFLAGRRSTATGLSRQFDRMRPDILLSEGSWRAEFDGDDPNTSQVILFDLQQVGSRVVGSGRSSDGTIHSLEGVLYQRRLCCICLDESRDGVWFGTVTGELIAGEQNIVGIRARWSPQSHQLIVRKATFTRLDSITIIPELVSQQ